MRSSTSLVALVAAVVSSAPCQAMTAGGEEDSFLGACCFADGSCLPTIEIICIELGGEFQGIGIFCGDVECPEPGACCYPDGSCDQSPTIACELHGGDYQGNGTSCGDIECPVTLGACCFDEDEEESTFDCLNLTEEHCWILHGTFFGAGTLCDGDECPEDVPEGACCLPDCTCEQMSELECQGWGGAYQGNETLCADVICVDTCDLPGRPSSAGTLVNNSRVLRGFIVGWAVNAAGEEIRWNHLSASLTTIEYEDGGANEYNAYTAVAVSAAEGAPTGTPGELNFDGSEYAMPFDVLNFQFRAPGSLAFSNGTLIEDPRLTLMPVDLNVSDAGEPVVTKAHFDVWNANEVKFSGAYRCVTCWDSTLLYFYGVPNHFKLTNLQTDNGRARVDGIASALCEESVDTPLLGTIEHFVQDPAGVVDSNSEVLYGAGLQAARLTYHVESEPPESPVHGGGALPGGTAEKSPRMRGRSAAAQASSVATPRFSASEKGSFFVLPRVEIRWDECGNLIQDAFVSLTNDHPDSVRVLMYFVNGDGELYEISSAGTTCYHPGWNAVDNGIELTGNEPTYWSVLTGQPKGVSPFTVLDP